MNKQKDCGEQEKKGHYTVESPELKGKILSPIDAESLKSRLTSDIRRSRVSSSIQDLFPPNIHALHGSIPKHITSSDEKYFFHCLDLIRNCPLRTSKVHILPNDTTKKVLVGDPKHTWRTNSSCSDKSSSSSSASAMLYQGILHCKWKDGVPHHVFSVDDDNEVYVAKLGASRDKDLDYVYTFHRREVELDSVGTMRVSTSITFCSDNSQMKETKFSMSLSNRHHSFQQRSSPNAILEEKDYAARLELAAVIVKEVGDDHEPGGWGLKFLRKSRNRGERTTSMDILIPAALHCGPRPSSLIERWISGGKCDCGGWDIGCPLTLLKTRSNLRDNSGECKSIDLLAQGCKEDEAVMRMVEIQEGLYYLHFQSNLSALQTFAIAAAIIHSHSPMLR